jgi:hypothetical protein
MPDPVIPEIILFEHPDFRGAHRHVFQDEPDLSKTFGSGTAGSPGGQFTNVTSSFVVVTGTWQLFDNTNFMGDKQVAEPGRYRTLKGMTINPDSVSSVRPVP